MYTCQQALITHLKAGLPSPTVKTIDAYAGELSREESIKLTQLLPAVLVMFQDGLPVAQDAELKMDLIVITESRGLDRKTNQKNNLVLASQVVAYLKSQALFQAFGKSGTYEISKEEMRATIILQNGRFTVIAISLTIFDRTQP